MLVALELFLVGELFALGLGARLSDELRRIGAGRHGLGRTGRHHRARRGHPRDEPFEIAPLFRREVLGGAGVGHSAGTATGLATTAGLSRPEACSKPEPT